MRRATRGSPTPRPEAGAVPWHAMAAADAVRALATDATGGLDSAEAARRLAADGPNALLAREDRGAARILVAQFTDLMVLVLVGAAIVAGALGDVHDAIAIGAILVVNALLGFVQEFRAERALAALRQLAAPQARVRRDGAVRPIDAESLVAGDLVRLEAGDLVPADLRLVATAELRVAEAVLTGESAPVEKDVTAVPADAPLGDRRGMVHRGTLVAHGRATGVVVATGMRTELGRIATLLHETPETRTPLQRRLARLTQRLALAVLALCVVLFVTGLLRGEAPGLMFLTALSLAVAAIPEALPAVVTVSLALGARRAAARQALIRRLPAVETLGSVTVICCDKTGTLTENRMRVASLRTPASPARDAAEDAPSPMLLRALALNNDCERGADGTLRGDPTEVALAEAAAARGLDPAVAAADWPRVAEFAFSAERGRMTTVHARAAARVAFTKGAPERVLARCREEDGSGVTRAAWQAAAEGMAADGMRVLAIAMRELPSAVAGGAAEEAAGPAAGPAAGRPSTADEVERDLTCLGLAGLLDPPRAEVREAVAECGRAGIRVVMVTGDHPATARAVAAQVGITAPVHARVTPEEKLAIVTALQAEGEVVAMTGDGVNDAPALKRADIGVAMGRGGTDVAREAADMVLLDDRFATIVNAVREGRRIHDNIRKFVRYALTCNSAELWTLLLAPFLGLPIPLLPIHILWINLVTDGLPGVALGLEPGERHLMRRPPRRADEQLLSHGLWQHALWVGLVMGGVTLGTEAWTWSHDAGHGSWQTMTFTVLAFLQLGHLLAIRSERDAFHVRFLRNPLLLVSVAVTVGLQLLVVYVPLLNRLLRTVPLTAGELAACVALSTIGFAAVELEKAAIRRGWIWRDPVAVGGGDATIHA